MAGRNNTTLVVFCGQHEDGRYDASHCAGIDIMRTTNRPKIRRVSAQCDTEGRFAGTGTDELVAKDWCEGHMLQQSSLS
jgi:hypothetical protein